MLLLLLYSKVLRNSFFNNDNRPASTWSVKVRKGRSSQYIPLKASFALSFSSSAFCTSEFAVVSMIVIILQLYIKGITSYDDCKTSVHTLNLQKEKSQWITNKIQEYTNYNSQIALAHFLETYYPYHMAVEHLINQALKNMHPEF